MATIIKYIPSPGLIKAQEIATYLNRPLLLSGEPGTGKTKFAEYLSQKDSKDLFVFNTKSVSQAKDLFYTYDTIGHFANSKRNVLEYIKIEALGKAIVNVLGVEKVKYKLLQEENSNSQLHDLRNMPPAERDEIVNRFLSGCSDNKTIVLIDEVDKAPRDFPNDILNEIENFEFDIRELNLTLSLRKEPKEKRDKIFVLLTSNFEKNLPEAFLRRCIYHHIEFIEETTKLKEIINLHLQDGDDEHFKNIDQDKLALRINEFLQIRKNPSIQKKPATSELVDCAKWITRKEGEKITDELSIDLTKNEFALFTLLKKSDDLKLYNYKVK